MVWISLAVPHIIAEKVMVSNTEPTLDLNGNSMDAHHGKILQFPDYPGVYLVDVRIYRIIHGVLHSLTKMDHTMKSVDLNIIKPLIYSQLQI